MLTTNQYFSGKVVSIAFQTATLPATVGVMQAGEYVFNTEKKEVMQVISGALTVQLPDATSWSTFQAGQTFSIEAKQSFKVKTEIDSAYLCTYE